MNKSYKWIVAHKKYRDDDDLPSFRDDDDDLPNFISCNMSSASNQTPSQFS
jgi:hypothetical protein